MKIKNNNIPNDKLSLQQLKVLCMHKKQDSDEVAISRLKRPGLLALWLQWQSRPDAEVNITTSATLVAPQGPNQNNIDIDDPVVDNHGDDTMIVDDSNIIEVSEL